MPLHVAHWMADPRVRMLDDAQRGRLIDSLSQSWMLGTAVPWMGEDSDAYPQRLREVFMLLWGQILALRQQHQDAFARKQMQTAKARAAIGKRKPVTGTVTESVTETVTVPVKPPEQSLLQPLLQTVTSSSSSSSSKAVTRANIQELTPDKPASTWLTPFADAWKARTGGTIVAGKVVSFLAPLWKEHGEGAVDAWTRYLAESDPKYLSASDFSAKYGIWSGTAAPAPRPLGPLTAAEKTAEAFKRVRAKMALEAGQ